LLEWMEKVRDEWIDILERIRPSPGSGNCARPVR